MSARYKKRVTAAIIFFAVCAAVCFLLLWTQSRSSKSMAPLTVTLLKVGKADAIIVQENESTMVIDTGEEDDGDELVEFLDSQGVSRVDTLIITHFDKDHVGGADTLVEAVEIGQVLLPDYQGNTTEYLDFMTALDNKAIVPDRLTEPLEFELGEATVLVEPPQSYEVPDNAEIEVDNNFSLITTVTHGDNRLLFTGDIEKQRIREWVSGETAAPCDFLKVPHHGIYNAALQELFETVQPKYAVICSSKKHPADSKTLELLQVNNIEVLQTKDGNVTVISDGSGLKLYQRQDA